MGALEFVEDFEMVYISQERIENVELCYKNINCVRAAARIFKGTFWKWHAVDMVSLQHETSAGDSKLKN